MRRAHVAVVVATTLVLTSCSLDQRPLRRGFAQDDTATLTTTSTTASPTAEAAPAVTSMPSSAAPGAKPRSATEFAALALPQAALTEDGLEVRESAAAAPSVAETVCGKQVDVPGRVADGYRIATRSQSGASKLDQRVTVYPKAKTVVVAVREALSCTEVELGALSGVDDAVGWCEELAGGRGACTTVLAKDDLAITLRMETISVTRAQDVVTRLATAAAGLLAKA